MLFKNSVRTSKRTPLFTITNINWLTLFKFKFILSQGLKTFDLILYVTSAFCTLHTFSAFYNTLARCKTGYVPVVRYPITNADLPKLERIGRKFADLCYTGFSNELCDYKYEETSAR
jgi:hypothetical protein